jgi:dethiobiotin synthetase
MSIFITGTDTDVGKTALTGLLLAALQEAGADVVPMKPVQTGCVDGVVPDLAFYERMTGRIYSARAHAPYQFEPACSPHLAAGLAGERIELPRIEAAFEELKAAHEMVLVEGAGGVLVPLNESQTLLDLMRRLGLPVLVAARPGLGTINHTLLTVEVLRQAGLEVLGVVIVQAGAAGAGVIEKDNIRAIEMYGKVPVLAVLPYLARLGDASFSYAEAAAEMGRAMAPIVSAILTEIKK